MRITAKTTLAEIREQLREDGFPALADLASEIKRAALTGCLLWTARRIVSTDASRIDEFSDSCTVPCDTWGEAE